MPTLYRLKEFISVRHRPVPSGSYGTSGSDNGKGFTTMLHHRPWLSNMHCSFKPHQSQKYFLFHSVTRIQPDIEPVDPTLSSEEDQNVSIDELEDFYQLWSCICFVLIALVLLAITWVKIKRKRPTPANIDLNFTKPYSYQPLPYKSNI